MHPHSCDLSAGVRVDDTASRITFHLRRPDPDFLAKLSSHLFAIPPGVRPGAVHRPVPATGPYSVRPRCQDVTVRDLPTRGLVRGARLAAVPASFVGRRVVGLGRRVGGQPAELIAAEVQTRTAEQLFAVLGELKGGAMKVGQWMSAMEAALPDQLAGPYGEALTRLQEAAPPMSTSLVHQVLAEELGRDWRDIFARFDDEPAAAASIGQVHRATWHDGRVVAVKVQYPRAGDALATDLRQLGRLVPLIRVAAPGLDARGLFTELRAQLMAEVDYQQEAAAQTMFADAFRDDADFLVPPVVEVADRVLVSEWMAGAPVAVIARRGERRERERTGPAADPLPAVEPVASRTSAR